MEGKTMPMVTVGVPTFNGGGRILNSLRSIWNQNYPNLEILISDNFSSDNTEELVGEIAKDHPEIRYVRQSANIGMIPNFFYVLKNAVGKYFIWVADDDKLEPGALLRYVDFLERNPEYSLASGKIRYWQGSRADFLEGGFTFRSNSRALRVIGFYGKVIYGGLLHGLMRSEVAQGIQIHNIIGNDFHFIANIAFLGKMENFEFVGYNKNFGGLSSNFRRYATAIGDTEFAGKFPQIKIAMDAYAEVMYRSQAFRKLFIINRFFLAVSSFFARLFCYYGRIAFWSRIQRHLIDPVMGNKK